MSHTSSWNAKGFRTESSPPRGGGGGRGEGGGGGKRGRDLASPMSITMSHRTMDQFFITIALLRTLYKHSRAQSKESRVS